MADNLCAGSLKEQTIVSRKLDPSQHGVVSVTGFETDGRRTFLPGLCISHETKGRVSFDLLFPPTINDAVAVEAAIGAAIATVGVSAVDGWCPPKLFFEDLAHFAARKPGFFVFMGNGTEGRHTRPLHAADYDSCGAAVVHGPHIGCTSSKVP